MMLVGALLIDGDDPGPELERFTRITITVIRLLLVRAAVNQLIVSLLET